MLFTSIIKTIKLWGNQIDVAANYFSNACPCIRVQSSRAIVTAFCFLQLNIAECLFPDFRSATRQTRQTQCLEMFVPTTYLLARFCVQSCFPCVENNPLGMLWSYQLFLRYRNQLLWSGWPDWYIITDTNITHYSWPVLTMLLSAMVSWPMFH